MERRLLQRFGFLLFAFCAGCGGASSLPTGTQPVAQVQQQVAQVQTLPPASALGADFLAPMDLTATATITGTATHCSDFYTCVYTISNTQGTGSASTSSDYTYPYNFNTYATFQLPGETTSTTNQPYNTTILGNVGTTYNLGGSLTAVDAATGKVVIGTTNDYIIRTQHCFRSCTYTYALSSGTISFALTKIDGTVTTVACDPATFAVGGSTKCVATVTDLANSASFPPGSVTFRISSTYGLGTFKPATCKLTSGSCSTKFTPTDESVGGISISASYPGNTLHYPSAGSTSIYVTGT